MSDDTNNSNTPDVTAPSPLPSVTPIASPVLPYTSSSSSPTAANEHDDTVQQGLSPPEPPSASSSPTSSSQSITSLQSAINSYRSRPLSSLRSSLDGHILSLSSSSSRSLAARRSLADQTRAFKRASEEERLTQIGTLLKAYQSEIDQLTERAKCSEDACIEAYKQVVEWPDPLPLMQSAQSQVDRVAALESELQSCQKTIEEYEQEFKKLKNEEVMIRSLKRQVRDMERSMDARIAEQVSERTAATEQALIEVKHAAIEQERAMTTKLESMQQELTLTLTQQSAREATALARATSAQDQTEVQLRQEVRLLEAEVEQLRNDLVRTQSQLTVAHSQQQQLQQSERDANTLADDAAEQRLDAASAVEIRRLEEELAECQNRFHTSEEHARSLLDKVDQSKNDVEAAQAKLRALERQHASEMESLKAQLAVLPSKDEVADLKQQIRLLQQLNETDTNGEGANGETQSDADAEIAALATPASTALLLSRYRALQRQLHALRQSHKEMEEQNDSLVREIASTQSQIQKLRETNAQLEKDLDEMAQNIQLTPGHDQGKGSIQQTKQRDDDASQSTEAWLAEAGGAHSVLTPAAARRMLETPMSHPSSEPATASSSSTIASTASSSSSSSSSSSALSSSSTTSSMLSIVISQRDRYRTRIDELESERNNLQSRLAELERTTATLKKDNIKLYEKLQFTKSQQQQQPPQTTRKENGMNHDTVDLEAGHSRHFSATPHSSPFTAASIYPSTTSTSSSASPDPESKYSAIWSRTLDPFRTFKQRARLAREQALPMSEKLTLAIGRMFFSKKSGRTCLFIYSLILHLLVMAVLWTHTISNHCGDHASDKAGTHPH